MYKLFQAYSGYGKYIYVQYSSKDTERMFPILQNLDKKGYNIWFDSNIYFDDKDRMLDYKRIDNCAVVLLFYSKNAAKSKLVKNTVKYISELKNDIKKICVCLDDCGFGMAFSDCKKNYTIIKRFDYIARNFIIELQSHIEECRYDSGLESESIDQNETLESISFVDDSVEDEIDSKNSIFELTEDSIPDADQLVEKHSEVQSEPEVIFTEPAEVQSEPEVIFTEPAEVQREPEVIFTEPAEV
ncbi:MAG: TIR domain-containing protein, partial [Firmicutes bacterium]|nr:TIR domain-containing protein [Bacillota bacterium]